MARTPPSSSELTTIFIDETSQTKHRYLALGAVVVNNDDVVELERRLLAARLPDLPAGEMAWTKVSASKLEAYKRFVDVFFKSGSNDRRPLQFHSLVVDTHRLKDKLYNKGSREIGFNKEIYQLCTKIGARLFKARLFHVYPDHRTTASRPQDLREILNNGMRRSGDPRDFPFRRMHFRNSADCPPLQLTDILLGSIAFKLNGHYGAPGASPAKRELSDHICANAGIADVTRDTARAGKFTVWHRRLK